MGLSGLITPSLDEMVNVATEMQRRGLKLPLLIGGATTSRQHTAVRVAPAYDGTTVHVLDASRVAGVVSDLLDSDRAQALAVSNRADQERLREQHENARQRPLLTIGQARANPDRVPFDDLPVPAFTGVRTVQPDLATLRGMIDWQFFFLAWELKGKYPAILAPAGRARTLRRRQRPARPDHRRPPLGGPGRLRLLARPLRGRRHPDRRRRPQRPRAHAAPANRQTRRQAQPVPRRLRGPRRGPPRRIRRRYPRCRRTRRQLRSQPRRLPVDHGQGTRRPARRSIRRARPPPGPARLVRTRRRPGRRRTCSPSSSAASAPRSATPPARTTARNERCSACSTPSSSA